MPYLHLDLAKTYPSETRRELAMEADLSVIDPRDTASA
jgi:hypothetical protein